MDNTDSDDYELPPKWFVCWVDWMGAVTTRVKVYFDGDRNGVKYAAFRKRIETGPWIGHNSDYEPIEPDDNIYVWSDDDDPKELISTLPRSKASRGTVKIHERCS